HARDLVILSARHSHVGHRVDGHEEEGNTCRLEHPELHGLSEAQTQVHLHHVEEGSRAGQESNGDQPSCVVMRNQVADKRHKRHDCKTTGGEGHPGALGGVAEKRLQILGDEHRGAEQRKAQHCHHDKGEREVAVLEHAHVNDRIFLEVLPNDGSNDADTGDYRKGQNEIGLEPVVALSFIENDLKAAEAYSHQRETDVIDLDSRIALVGELGRIFDQTIGQKQREYGYGNVDEENPAPVVVVSDPST